MNEKTECIAIIGGTGALGNGLARRLAHAGYRVVIGSRDAEKAKSAARSITDDIPTSQVSGDTLTGAAQDGDMIFLAVPFGSHRETLEMLKPYVQNKLLVDATVPLVPPKVMRVQLPAEGAAALIAQSILGEGVEVVSALQNVGARHLPDLDHEIDCDVLVCGDKREARGRVIQVLADCGLRGFHAGSLANAAAAEALTSLLIFMNKHYNTDRAGIRLTNIDPEAQA
jgi:NADPH-dependent F420 reductase